MTDKSILNSGKSNVYKVLLLLLFSVLLLEPIYAGAEKELTFMIYMAADNDLESAAIDDINELETCGSTDKVNFVVQIDRNGKYSQNSAYKWSGTRRYYITKDNDTTKIGSRLVQKLNETDTAEPLSLIDFVYWAKGNYPAKRYALILWSHGTGWKKIKLADNDEESKKNLSSSLMHGLPNAERNFAYDYTSKTSMTIPTFADALSKIRSILGQQLEILGFDACLMQMAEVAYVGAPFAKFQVGSPDREPDRGWPYDMIANAVSQKPDMDAKALGTTIAGLYKKSYNNGSQGNTAVLLSVIDMAAINSFRTALDNFCNIARRNITDIDKIETARASALKYHDEDYVDLGHFLELLSASDANKELKIAAESLLQTISASSNRPGYVCHLSRNGKVYNQSRGLSIFFPTPEGFAVNKEAYKKHQFCTSTEWFNFIQETAEPDIAYFKIEDVIIEDQSKDGRITAGEEIEIFITLRNFGRKPAARAELSCSSTSKYLDGKMIVATVSKLPAPGKSQRIRLGKFKIIDSTPVGSKIKLTISFKAAKTPSLSFQQTLYVNEPFAANGQALLVTTDASSKGSQILQQMLKRQKVSFDIWDRVIDGDLRAEILKRYAGGWVIVSAQDSTQQQSLSTNEIAVLDRFLKAGGRLVLNGQDLGFSLRNSKFLQDRCRAEFVQDDVNVHILTGVQSFVPGKSFRIFGGDGANNQKWPDEIDPLSGAVPIIRYDEKADDNGDDSKMVGPVHKPVASFRGIKSSGVAGVKVENGYRLMLFTFGIEAIADGKSRQAVMKAVVDFMQPEPKDEARNLAVALLGYSATENKSDQERMDRADMLANVEKRLLQQVIEGLKQNALTGEALLEEINHFSQDEQTALIQFKSQIKTLLEFKREHDR